MTAAVVSQLVQPFGSRITSQELMCEVDEYFALGARVFPGDTVVDVGANVGAFSARVAEKCYGDVRLLCFEPSPDSCAALRNNFDSDPLLRKTRHRIEGSGLTSVEAAGSELPFHVFRRFPTNSSFDLATKRREFEIFFEYRSRRIRASLERTLGWSGRMLGHAFEAIAGRLSKSALWWWVTGRVMGLETIHIRLEALGDVLTAEHIERVDLLKIDVEGYELDVLKGLSYRTWPLIQQVVVETNDVAGRRGEIESLLRANGFARLRSVAQTTSDNGLDSVLLLATRG